MIFFSIVDAIGHTPLVRLRLPGTESVEVYAKLELANPFAMKDRVARSIILQARRTGELADGAPIVESSSGTMALGVALVGRTLGHPVHIVTDPRIDRITLAKLRALGVEVHIVRAMTGQGWQSARLEELDRLRQTLPGAFWCQQYSNPDNPAAYRSLAAELRQDLGELDVLVGSVGSGGSLCGTARSLREVLPGIRVIGVDAVGSVLFGQPDWPKRLQSGLGNSLLPKNLDRRVIDEVHWLNDREAFESARALAAEQQIFAGNTSGSVYRVLKHLAAMLPAGSRAVGIFPDRGDRYVDTVYSDAHWAEHALPEQHSSPAPARVAPGEVVRNWSSSLPLPVDAPIDQHLVFVESNTTGTGMMALRAACAMGYVPVLLTDDPARYTGLAEAECRIEVCDTASSASLRTILQDRFRREELAGVTTTSDFYVTAVAELAAWLGLPGNRPEAVAACRDKAATRRILRSAGVSQPAFAVVDRLGQVAAALTAIGLPCIVKPTDDTGSNNVLLCRTGHEVHQQVERILATECNVRGLPMAGTALIEEYVDGPEFSVELFSQPGRTTCIGITQKFLTGSPCFVENQHVFPADLPAAQAETLRCVAIRAVAAAGIELGPSHTEIRLVGGEAKIIEINPRLAGGMIPELARLATGVSLLDEQLRTAVGLTPSLQVRAGGYAGIRFLMAERTGILRTVAGVEQARRVDGVEAVVVTARPGTQVRPVRNAYDRLGYVIAHGGTAEAVLRSCVAAMDRLEVVLAEDDAVTGTASEEVAHDRAP